MKDRNDFVANFLILTGYTPSMGQCELQTKNMNTNYFDNDDDL